MANAIFDNYGNLLLGNGTHTLPDLDTDTIKVHAIDSADHTINVSADIDEADITNAAIVDTGTLGSKTVGVVAAKVFDAADTTLASVSGDQFEQLVLWMDSGLDTTSPLICMFDTNAAGSSISVTPTGADIVLSWAAAGIMKAG